MDSMISVGGKLGLETMTNMAEFVIQVFTAGRAQGMDPETIRRALSLIEGCVKAEHVSIQNCTLTSKSGKGQNPDFGMRLSTEDRV